MDLGSFGETNFSLADSDSHLPGVQYGLLWEETSSALGSAVTQSGSSRPGQIEERNPGTLGERRRLVWNGSPCDFFGCGSQGNVDGLRQALGAILVDAKALKAAQISITLHLGDRRAGVSHWAQWLEILAETTVLGLYRAKVDYGDDKCFIHPSSKPEAVTFCLPSGGNASSPEREVLRTAAQAGLRAGSAYNFARSLGDTPPNFLSPEQLVRAAHARLGNLVQSTILSEEDLKNQGFGGLLAVGKGSARRPFLGLFDYAPENAKGTVVLIGKGITFDTGGYSIKGKQHHNEMKYDMCGAANVVAALEVLAFQKVPLRVVGVIGCAENMIGEEAQRPGDVYRAWNGKYVEVYNTDAEGRLILADLLAFAQSFRPDLVVDIATLTGGASQIAGNLAGIVCTNEESLFSVVRKAAARAGERFIPLEIPPEAIKDMQSQVAHYTNMHHKWSSGAPTLYAAAFLREFVPQGVPWVHLDIANVAWNGRENGYMSGSGANAYGARTLVELTKLRCP